MHADWKWTGDRGERRLADGRALQVQCGAPIDDTDPEYWIAAIVMPDGVEFLLSSTGTSTRESAVEAVEKAAGVWMEPLRVVASVRSDTGRATIYERTTLDAVPESATDAAARVMARAAERKMDPPQTPLQAARDTLRAENTLLRECNEAMRDGMKGLRERLSGPTVGAQTLVLDPPQVSESAIARGKAIMAITQPCAPEADGFIDPDPFDPPQTALQAAVGEPGTLGVVTLTDAPAVEQKAKGPYVTVHKAFLAELQESRDALRAAMEREAPDCEHGDSRDSCGLCADKKDRRELVAVTSALNDALDACTRERDALRAENERLPTSVAYDLLVERDALREENERLKQAAVGREAPVLSGGADVGPEVLALVMECDALRAENERLTRERDEQGQNAVAMFDEAKRRQSEAFTATKERDHARGVAFRFWMGDQTGADEEHAASWEQYAAAQPPTGEET